MRSLIHRVLVSVLTIVMVYAILPAQKVLADPLSISPDSLTLRVYETAFVTISGGGESKTYGVAVAPNTDVACACKIRDTILVIGLTEGSTVITVYDFETGYKCYLSVNVTYSKVLETPGLTVTTEGNTLTLSWSRSQGADGYILYYAPPYMPSLGKLDLGYIPGPTCTVSGEFPSGSDYYVIIQAYDVGGFSNFSNIGHFIIE
jgi:hypothetical protein